MVTGSSPKHMLFSATFPLHFQSLIGPYLDQACLGNTNTSTPPQTRLRHVCVCVCLYSRHWFPSPKLKSKTKAFIFRWYSISLWHMATLEESIPDLLKMRMCALVCLRVFVCVSLCVCESVCVWMCVSTCAHMCEDGGRPDQRVLDKLIWWCR